jgi:hypothetical protein
MEESDSSILQNNSFTCIFENSELDFANFGEINPQ